MEPSLASNSPPPSNPTIEPYTSNLVGVDQKINSLDQRLLWGSLGLLALSVLALRVVSLVRRHLRHLSTMTANIDQQRFWARNQSLWWSKVKRDIIYAPLRHKRHTREIQLSSAVNMGTIPSRLHSILLAIYLLSNVAYCVGLNYHFDNHFEIVAQLRGRSGTLAVANMIPLVILAGRNNPLIGILQVSFDTYNLLHRWMGRMVVLEVLVHTSAWAVAEVSSANWKGVKYKLITDSFILSGFVGTVAMIVILVTSPSAVRHAFYETFLNVHIICAAAAFSAVWIHCDMAKLPQLPWVQAAVGLWIADRGMRLLRIVWTNFPRKGRGWTKATVESLPGDTVRVTLHLPTYVKVKPGSHAYLRFSAFELRDLWTFSLIGAWESHPFSIAWTEHKARDSNLPTLEKWKVVGDNITDVSFVIRAKTGITRRVYNRALKSSGHLVIKAAFEGPYGGYHSLASYGHCLLIAGASGITFHLSFLRYLLAGHTESTVATRRITLVWITQDIEHLQWIQPWLDEMLMSPSRDILSVKLFITRPKTTITAVSNVLQVFSGRPNLQMLVEQESKEQVGAMCVTVCGPGGMADDVRQAVRSIQTESVVDFVEESFTW